MIDDPLSDPWRYDHGRHSDAKLIERETEPVIATTIRRFFLRDELPAWSRPEEENTEKKEFWSKLDEISQIASEFQAITYLTALGNEVVIP